MSMDITRRSNFADRGGVGYSYLLDTFAPLASGQACRTAHGRTCCTAMHCASTKDRNNKDSRN